MGKKPKGKGNKLARMSDEERARYLQHRADIEEEARRRKQQLIATFMKNKLKKEDAFARLNLAKINQEWRSILRQIKGDELHNELQAVEQECIKSVDRKNAVIRRLLCDLDESEEIYSTMLHTHMENIETLIKIHSDRLQFLKTWYQEEKQHLLECYREEIKIYKAKKQQSQLELECVFYGLAEKASADTKLAEEDHMQKKDELNNSMILKLEDITKEREAYMERLWSEFQAVLTRYLKNTEDYRSEFVDLRDRDNEDTRYFESHYAEIAQTSDVIATLKVRYASIKDEHEFNVKRLNKYKRGLHDRHDNLKTEMDVGLAVDRQRLKQLVLVTNAILKHFEAFDRRGRQITQIAAFCKKYETERDTTAPSVRKRGFLEFSEEELSAVPKEMWAMVTKPSAAPLEHFWRRYNRTKIDCACLREEKVVLRAENQKLKAALKEYLINVNIAAGTTIKKEAKLLPSRPNSMKVEKVVHIDLTKQKSADDASGVRRRRPVTCIEANFSNAVRSRSLIEARSAGRPTEMYSIVQKT